MFKKKDLLSDKNGQEFFFMLEGPPGEGVLLFSPGHARASVNTWRGIFEPSVNTHPEGDVKSIASEQL